MPRNWLRPKYRKIAGHTPKVYLDKVKIIKLKQKHLDKELMDGYKYIHDMDLRHKDI